LARLTPDDLQELAITPPDWRLGAITDVPFCAPCWIEGQRLQGFAYLQGAWMHAGRISCPSHGDWLFSARDKLGRESRKVQCALVDCRRRRATQGIRSRHHCRYRRVLAARRAMGITPRSGLSEHRPGCDNLEA
jgi:hypothetical protein